MIAEHVVEQIRGKAAAATVEAPPPFALFAGFKRPHLGFAVPQWALDLYPEDVHLAADRAPPPGFPQTAWSGNGEINSFPDVGPFDLKNATFPGMLADAKHGELRRAYYAAVSLVDAQIGKLLDALDSSGLRSSTWVVLTGDHGWSLGEHGSWAKITLFETAARVPLIVAPPSGPSGAAYLKNATLGASVGLVSHTDIFPTLLEVLGLKGEEGSKGGGTLVVEDAGAGVIPAGQLCGSSFAPLLRVSQSPQTPPGGAGGNFSAAFTQIIRQNFPKDCTHAWMGGNGGDAASAAVPSPAALPQSCPMGLSIRVFGWRYSCWVGFDYGNLSSPGRPLWGDLRGEELYDHRADDTEEGGVDSDNDFNSSELVDVAMDPSFKVVKHQLLQRLQSEWI